MTTRTPDCPSDLRLDRLDAGELPPEDARSLTEHIAACAACGARIASRADDRRAFDTLPPDLTRRIHQATAGRTPPAVEAAVNQALGKPPAGGRTSRWPAWLTGWQLPTLVAVGLAVALVVRPGAPTPVEPNAAPLPPETVTAKGGLGLTVHRKRGQLEEVLVSGDTARAGDRLAFEADLPADGWAMVVGVEASGKPYVAWPYDGRTEAAAVVGGDDQLWPGAAELDASVGTEWLVLVWCEQAFRLDGVRWMATERRVAPTSGCRSTVFELVKTRP